jgi:phospholipid-binding lipoprotein MlaA
LSSGQPFSLGLGSRFSHNIRREEASFVLEMKGVIMKRAVIGFWCLALAAALPTAVPALADEAKPGVWDPLESVNRGVYSFNSAFDDSIAHQVATAYGSTVPESVRAGVDNVFTNLREPLTVVASGLSGDLKNAGLSAGRFAINTTAGIAGIYDVATGMGWVSRPADFGMTMCHYNVPTGPYLVLPFIGASTARDAVGVVAAYWAAFWTLEGWAPTYIVADRAAAYGSVPAPASAATAPADGYAAQRDQFLALRAGACDNSVAGLKASPFGGVTAAAPHS